MGAAHSRFVQARISTSIWSVAGGDRLTLARDAGRIYRIDSARCGTVVTSRIAGKHITVENARIISMPDEAPALAVKQSTAMVEGKSVV